MSDKPIEETDLWKGIQDCIDDNFVHPEQEFMFDSDTTLDENEEQAQIDSMRECRESNKENGYTPEELKEMFSENE